MTARAVTLAAGVVLVALLSALRLTDGALDAAPPLCVACDCGCARVSLEDLRGKTVVVEFFALWCPESRRDVQRLEELRRRVAPREDVEVLAVAIDGTPRAAEMVVRAAGGGYRVGTADVSLAAAFGVTRVPARVIVDPEGRILKRGASFAQVLEEVDP